jgi:hypothetical protein
MKRRTFILAAAASVAAATIPVVKYKYRDTVTHDPLLRPDALAHFCDENTIREIGNRYRTQVPSESTKERLTELLLTDSAGKKLKPAERSAIAELIKKKIHEEFLANKAIVVKGWVISSTEARQCALYSLI